MIKGIGCDSIEIQRVERLLPDRRFLEKVYTPYEQAFVQEKSAHTAAGIFAAKEAVSKALGTGFVGFRVKDVEVCHAESGQPYVRLHGNAEKRLHAMDARQVLLSISHDNSRAMAFAVIE